MLAEALAQRPDGRLKEKIDTYCLRYIERVSANVLGLRQGGRFHSRCLTKVQMIHRIPNAYFIPSARLAADPGWAALLLIAFLLWSLSVVIQIKNDDAIVP